MISPHHFHPTNGVRPSDSIVEDNSLKDFINEQVGFYPAEKLDAGRIESLGVLRMPDTEHVPDISYKWLISDSAINKGLSMAQKMMSLPPKYNAETYNCVDAVVSVGEAAGVLVPHTKGKKYLINPLGVLRELGNGISNAGDLGEDLRALERRAR